MKIIEYIILTLSSYNDTQLETISNKCVSPIITGRRNSDGTKCIIKVYTSDLPDHCGSLTRYSKSEIMEVAKGSEWQIIKEIPDE